MPDTPICTGPFHLPTPSTHDTCKAPLLPTARAVSVLAVCFAIAVGDPGGKKLVELIGMGPFHLPVPTTHETRKDPSLPTDSAVSTSSVCLAIAILLRGRVAVA